MNIKFLGVGEAFDERYPNNSHVLVANNTNLLVDCGYSVPQQWWKLGKDANFLDAIYISHKHADHFFGLLVLLMRIWEEGRTKPLAVICQTLNYEMDNKKNISRDPANLQKKIAPGSLCLFPNFWL